MALRSRWLPTPLAVALLLLAAPRGARAQDNSAAVEGLFAEGKKLMTEGKIAEACPKFLASYNLDNRSGTLLNLADCYEKNGQLASAWARFLEAKALAARAGQTDRAELATQRGAALEPRLSKLTITVPRPADGLVVARDGVPVAAAAYGVAVPVDAGKHTLNASAPNKTAWASEIVVGAQADRKNVEVPELVDAPSTAPPPVAPAPQPEERHGPSTRTILGLSVAGAGVVSVGLGVYFGFAAVAKNRDSYSSGCGQDGQATSCTSAGLAVRSTAVSDGNVSTILITAGAVAVAGGVVLWLTDPGGKTPTTVGFDGRMLRVGGSF